MSKTSQCCRFLLSSYLATGSFSRTAVNARLGARSEIANLVSIMLVLLTLLVLTPLFYYLPLTVLAAIIITAVMSMFDFREVIFLWQANKADLLVLLTALFGTLLLGVEVGISIAVALSLLMMSFQIAAAKFSILALDAGSGLFVDCEENTLALIPESVSIVRLEESILFLNASYFKERVQEVAKNGKPYIVLDLSSCNLIDSAAVHALQELAEELHNSNQELMIAQAKPKVYHLLKKGGLISCIGEHNIFGSILQAYNAALERLEPPSEFDGRVTFFASNNAESDSLISI